MEIFVVGFGKKIFCPTNIFFSSVDSFPGRKLKQKWQIRRKRDIIH